MSALRALRQQIKDLPFFAKFGAFMAIGAAFWVTAGILVWNMSGIGAAPRDAEVLYRKLEANGTPLNLEGFVASFAVTEEDNCAKELEPVIKRVHDKIKNLPPTDQVILRSNTINRNNRYSAKKDRERILSQFEEELSLLHRASTRSSFVFSLDWATPTIYHPAQFDHLKSAAMLASSSAIRYAELGKVDDCIRDLRLVLKLSKFAADVPLIYGSLTELSSTAHLHYVISTCLALLPSRVDLFAALVSEKQPYPPERVLRTEAYVLVALSRDLSLPQLFEWFGKFEDESAGSHPAPVRNDNRSAGTPSDPVVKAAVGGALQWYWEFLREAGAEGRPRSEDAMWEAAMRVDDKYDGPGFLLLGPLAPPLKPLLDATTERQARCRILKALFRVSKFRSERKRWPGTLSEAGALYEDPFRAGEPLGYRVTDLGIRVWSVGKDGEDQGGLTRAELTASGLQDQARDVLMVLPTL